MAFALFQFIFGNFAKILGYGFLNFKVRGTENIEKLAGGEGVLFVSNHHGGLDPFLIGAAIPSSYYKKVKCFRYLTYYKYITRRLYGPLIWLMGAYPVKPEKYKCQYGKSLGKTVDILRSNQSVLMFPTGKLESDFDAGRARPGAAYLARTVNPQIMPVYISDSYRIRPIDLLLRRRNVTVTFGEPFRYADLDSDSQNLKSLAESIMRRVGELRPVKAPAKKLAYA